MKARTKLQLIELKYAFFKYFNLIPFLIIILVLVFIFIVIVNKIFPNFSDNWTISFLSALIGAIIGTASSFYIMFATRKNDNIDKIILEKQDKIYKPFYEDIKAIMNHFKDNEIVDHNKIAKPFWYNFIETDSVLLLPKDMYRLLEKYYNELKNYRKLFIDTYSELESESTKIISENTSKEVKKESVVVLLHELFIKPSNATENINQFPLMNKYNDPVDEENTRMVIKLVQECFISNQRYHHLEKMSNEIKKLTTEYIELIEYILKSIIYRFYRDNSPI